MTQTETTKDRLRLILGEEGLARLDGACVMVIGLGGVGSNCVEALARGGVGNLVLLDRDVVAPSNVNRQAVAYASTIGRPKADVARAMVLDINPEARVTAVQAFLPKDGIDQTLAPLPRPDYVVDAIDTVAQKLQLAVWCQRASCARSAGAAASTTCRSSTLTSSPSAWRRSPTSSGASPAASWAP